MKASRHYVVIKGKKESLIMIDGKWYYEHHRCKHCGERIPYPTTCSGLNNHKRRGVPKYKHNHFKKLYKMRITMSKNNPARSSEARLKISLANSGKNNPAWVDGYGIERANSKNRGLGFIPLNQKTETANSTHHLDDKHVLFMPHEIHFSMPHSVKTGKNMAIMNALAFEWFNKNKSCSIEKQSSLFDF